MPTFKSVKALEKYIESNIRKGGFSQYGINANVVDSEAEKILKEQSEFLAKCIRECIKGYYETYSPKFIGRYTGRTYGLQNSISVSPEIDSNGNKYTGYLEFNENTSYGTSLFGGSAGYKPALIDSGWRVSSDVWFKNIEHFGYYDGYGFIQKGIDMFNQNNPYKLKIKKPSWAK